jgi:hypothetical protein
MLLPPLPCEWEANWLSHNFRWKKLSLKIKFQTKSTNFHILKRKRFTKHTKMMKTKGPGQQGTWSYCQDEQSHKSTQGNNYASLEMSTKLSTTAMMGKIIKISKGNNYYCHNWATSNTMDIQCPWHWARHIGGKWLSNSLISWVATTTN